MDSCHYYLVLGIPSDASSSDVRSAYKKLAMKWHPDKWAAAAEAEAKRRFQDIQEAYSVLSDDGKRAMYDMGLYDPQEEQDQGFCDFMQEMVSMMNAVACANCAAQEEDHDGGGGSFEELQRMFSDLVRGGEEDAHAAAGSTAANRRNGAARKRSRASGSRRGSAKRGGSAAASAAADGFILAAGTVPCG